MPTRRRSGWLLKTALALGSTLVTLVAADCALRMTSLVTPRRGVMQPVPARHALTSWIDVFPPGYTGRLVSKEFSVQIRTGSLGLRERDLDVPALAAQRPILLLGDSYFFGWGVEQHQRLSEVLARQLADAGRPVPVVNLSFPGWGTYHYLEVWHQYVPALRPRLVVVSLFIGNDFTDNLKQADRARGDGAGGAGTGMRLKLAAREILSTSPIVGLVNQALWASPRFRRFFSGLEVQNDRIAIYEVQDSALKSQLYAATDAALAALALRSRQDGVPVLAVVIPDHLQVLMPELFQGYDLEQPQRRLKATLEAGGIPSLDLLPPFRALEAPQTMFFNEDKHWNARGHEYVAGLLLRRLSEGGWTQSR